MVHRILIVDDEEDIRTIAAMALDEHSDMDVRTCASGTEGLQIAAWWQPDLILLDVRMPGLTGPDTLKRLRGDDRTAGIPIVFFTASIQKHEKASLIDLGAQGLISKPFDPMALAEQIGPFLLKPAVEGGAAAAEADRAARSNDGGASDKSENCLLYVSRNLLQGAEADAELRNIIATARRKNEPCHVTGALMSTPAHFAQYLEGPAEAVELIMTAIRQDVRHEDVRVVPTPAFSRRHFGEWSMAYGGSSLFVANLVRSVFEDQTDTGDSQKLIRLMREFSNSRKAAA
jgi:CheY-like chemotaxis protein